MTIFKNKNANKLLLIMGLLLLFPKHTHATENIKSINENNLLIISPTTDKTTEGLPQIHPSTENRLEEDFYQHQLSINTDNDLEENTTQLPSNIDNTLDENTTQLPTDIVTPKKNPISEEQNLDLDVSIDVMPSMINVEVDFNSSFIINPNVNQNSRFVAPHITIRNNSVVPISVTAVSLKALGDSPKIVADNYYTDQEWSELNAKETRASIALGLVSLDNRFNSFYFKEESYQTPIVLEDCLNPYEEMSFRFQSKYGLYWKEECTLDYKLLIKILIAE